MDSEDKNETTRFLGDGVSFKAKLIGILEVSEARGDRMCQEALSDLKMAIRAAGEHKQRITINIAIDGLRLRDEKTGDSLYHHPVHKISFIAQDMTDSRAFGYIFGSPDTGHRFFGIKTDKAASQVVIAMRDLFQVVFALKKKEIELAKQHLDKNRFGTSPLFSDTNNSSLKVTSSSVQENTKTVDNDSNKTGGATSENRSTPAVADLVDLELELNSLQQGLTQMERITPSDPFGSKDDPFGDSFTPYPKPILPPPPSGRERSSRLSESSSIFSPKTPHTGISIDSSVADTSLFSGSRELNSTPKEFSFSHDFNTSHDEPSSGDWFTPSAGNSLFEEPPLVPEQPKDQHEAKKKEILSQFDVFTDLDPLGIGNIDKKSAIRCTGKIKPYVDKKHFFQELKNPPKKVLNDLVSESQPPQEPPLFPATFEQNTTTTTTGSDFSTDPFQDDPFDVDPFVETEFMKQDPFETADLNNDFRFNQTIKTCHKIDNLSKSPKERQRNVQFSKQNTFDVQFEKFEDKKFNKLTQLHENPSLDLSSESECAPEPPPRPTNNLAQIKPPPLPPKKQPGDLNVKPPPRPPHTDDNTSFHYDYMDHYETAPNSLEFIKNLDNSPPLPVPARKSKFESDFTTPVPQRPKKQFNNLQQEDDYLTPVSFIQPKENVTRHTGPLLLPPPQKSNRKHNPSPTTASLLENKPITTTTTTTNQIPTEKSLEGLDITLSQLTLSGLNELATKLNIPPSQLSNMTLVQLTSYLSNFIKGGGNSAENVKSTSSPPPPPTTTTTTFQADFAANFNNLNITNANETSMYDRYAVFRELIQEEIKQTKIDTEPEEITENNETTSLDQTLNNFDPKPTNEENSQVVIDKYAALREIVENEIKKNKTTEDDDGEDDDDEDDDDEEEEEEDNIKNENEKVNNHVAVDDQANLEVKIENEANIFNTEKTLKDKEGSDKDNVIEYGSIIDNKVDLKATTPVKSPVMKTVKSPIPVAVTDVIQNNTRLNSGSLSDVISGSSPEVDNTASTSDVKKSTDAAGESWAIFDQPNVAQDIVKDKQNVQSEEGVSPWSSDSKEFGNGSPTEWRPRGDSGSGGDHWPRRSKRDQEGWWDTSAEPEAQYYPPNRRSTDSYDEECYECYDRPRRRRQQQTWSTHGSQAIGGGHSSSSRDVSPWEEEPRRREHRDNRQTWSSRHARQHSFDRHRDRRRTDSWDEEDDYEYEEEHSSNRCHWPERHISSRESEIRNREVDGERWADDWSEDRRHRRRRETDRDRWCCPDWDQADQEKPSQNRYGSGRWSNPDTTTSKWRERDRKHDERYYSRDSQDSPWEDEHEDHSSHYLTAKRNWKRPSSASEMDRKTGEIKGRSGQYYLGTGGSDGERDRRYKIGRRSKSRDSQFSEPTYGGGRHKIDQTLPTRNRSKFQHQKGQFENDFVQDNVQIKKVDTSKLDLNTAKKSSTMLRSKKKESPKVEEAVTSNTFPRKGTLRAAQSLFENDFVPSESESPQINNTRFTFERDCEMESPVIVNKHVKNIRQNNVKRNFETDFTKDVRTSTTTTKMSFKDRKPSPRFQGATTTTQKSLFEDDFSPTERLETDDNNGISIIKEETNQNESEDSFSLNNFDKMSNRKNRLSKGRFTSSGQLKKSESVNIFARENDPFDDEFFSGHESSIFFHQDKEKVLQKIGSSSGGGGAELKWTEEFDDFDIQEEK